MVAEAVALTSVVGAEVAGAEEVSMPTNSHKGCMAANFSIGLFEPGSGCH